MRADVDEHDVRLDLGRLDLEARDLLEQRAELARAPVVVGEPFDLRVERDERRSRRDARLVHARAAEPAQRLVRELDHLRAAGENRTHRRAEALVQADRHRVRRGRKLRHRDAERDRGVEEPRPVEMDVGAVALRRARPARPSAPARGPCRRPACACSRARASARPSSTIASSTSTGSSRPSSAQSDHGSRPATSSIPIASEVRTCDEASRTTVLPRGAIVSERDQVRHPAGRHPERLPPCRAGAPPAPAAR